jgi:uncharacterized protein involved in exopolysaccharide biosynthesis
MEQRRSNDEIDLLDIFLRGINLIRANIVLITTVVLLGGILGLARYYTARKIFENKMVVSSDILTEPYGKILIDKLNRYLGEGNREFVARDLKVSENTVKGVSQMKIEELSQVDESKENDRFIISVETYDQSILPELQQGIVHYLENNQYVKVRVDQNKTYLNQVVAKIDEEIKDLEAFKTTLYKGDFFQGSRAVMFDPTVVNSKIIELTKEKLTAENSFELANSVHVIEGLTPFNKPTKPRLSISLGTGLLTGIFFVVLILAIKSIKKLLKMADASKRNP